MNQRAYFIIPECYIDTNLVETLVCSSGCNNQKGCNQVAKVIQKKFADRFAVSIIDADKRRPGYLNEFYEMASSEHIQLFRHSKRPHFMILIHPAADGFILSCDKMAQIDETDSGLLSVLKGFTSQTKDVMSNKDLRFKRLFKSMRASGEIKLMELLISYFVTHRYTISDKNISDFFSNF